MILGLSLVKPELCCTERAYSTHIVHHATKKHYFVTFELSNMGCKDFCRVYVEQDLTISNTRCEWSIDRVSLTPNLSFDVLEEPDCPVQYSTLLGNIRVGR